MFRMTGFLPGFFFVSTFLIPGIENRYFGYPPGKVTLLKIYRFMTKPIVTITPASPPHHSSIFTPGNLVQSNVPDRLGEVIIMITNSWPGGFSGVVLTETNMGDYNEKHKMSDYVQFRGKITLDTTGE